MSAKPDRVVPWDAVSTDRPGGRSATALRWPSRGWLCALLLGSVALVLPACDPSEDGAEPHAVRAAALQNVTFGLYVVWFEGAGDDNRAEIDRFLECLVDGSNLREFWDGRVDLVRHGSSALPRPAERLDHGDVAAWLTPHVEAERLPRPRADETPIYLVIGGEPDLWVGACGRNGEAVVADRRAGLGVIGNRPLCWPTGERLRTETQILAHELVETIDRLLGLGTCAGGGACRGRAVCADHCDTFVGLQCPGAPTGTWTGCEGGRVDGWVVQRFSRAGRDPALCDRCTACDFTPRACRPGETGCGDPTRRSW